MPDRYLPAPGKTGALPPETIRAAYNRLGVDAGYLSSVAARWFGKNGGPPAGFARVDAAPVARCLPVPLADGRRLAVVIVFFPPLSEETATAAGNVPPDELLDGILAVARAAGRNAGDERGERRRENGPPPLELVVGISPWGFQAERFALPRLAGTFHLLLGAGAGAPLTAEVFDDAPSVLWSRADVDGRGVIVLDLIQPPARGQNWNPLTAVWAREIEIAPPLPVDPEMERLLQ